LSPWKGKWKGKFAFFFLRNFLTQKAAGFCKAQNDSLTFSKILDIKNSGMPSKVV
jgi:hypothetical protein